MTWRGLTCRAVPRAVAVHLLAAEPNELITSRGLIELESLRNVEQVSVLPALRSVASIWQS